MADDPNVPRKVNVVINDEWDDPDRWEVFRGDDGEIVSVTISGKMWDRVRDQGGSLQGLVEDLLRKGEN